MTTRAFFRPAAIAALCCASQSLAQPAADPFGWERSRVAAQGQEHYWATRLSKPPGVVGLHDVFLVELFKAEKPFSMPLNGKQTQVHGVAHQRVYNCASGAYRTINLYLMTSPDVLSAQAEQVKISLPDDDPEMRGTLKAGSSHRAFLDERCSTRP